jgi:hypothetical protein
VDFSKKKVVLATAVFVFAGSASALSFDVSVEKEFRYDVQSFEYSENSSDLQSVNASIMNTGSVPCSFRLKTVFNTSDRSINRKYSGSTSLEPGQHGFLELYRAPDVKGESPAAFYLKGCDGWNRIARKELVVNEAASTNNTVDFSKKRAEEGLIQIKIEDPVPNSGFLFVPVEKPAYWKVPSTKTEKRALALSYRPETYSPSENITYMVFNRSSKRPHGVLTVSVEPKDSFQQRFQKTALPVLLVLSAALNILFAYRARR